MLQVPVADPAKDAAALARCAEDDPSGEVAASCVTAPAPRPARTTDVSVYVVPTGASAPVPGAPFALIFVDGLTRLGVADQSGGVYEYAAPRGAVRLGVPAALLF
jgi:hypothetical protein